MMNSETILDIEELEDEIAALCQKRAELLYNLGIEERYFVYNNKSLEIADDAWVLSAKSNTDRRVLDDISNKEYYASEWREKIKAWLMDLSIKNTDYSGGDV